MSTGIDIPNDVIGLLAETVERGASLLAGGSRLAGPAAAQDEAAELAPDESAGTVGLGLSFADDTAVVVVLTNPLAEELCGGSSPDHVRSGLQVLIDEITTGLGVPLADSVGLAFHLDVSKLRQKAVEDGRRQAERVRQALRR